MLLLLLLPLLLLHVEALPRCCGCGLVQIWDLRNFHVPVCELVAASDEPSVDSSHSPHLVPANLRRVVKFASWCPSKPGLVAGVIKEESYVMLWDAFRPEQDPQIIPTSEPPSCIAWERFGTAAGPLYIASSGGSGGDEAATVSPAIPAAQSASSMASIERETVLPVRDTNALAWNRMFAVSLRCNTLEDVCVIPPALALSPHGDVATSAGIAFRVLHGMHGGWQFLMMVLIVIAVCPTTDPCTDLFYEQSPARMAQQRPVRRWTCPLWSGTSPRS